MGKPHGIFEVEAYFMSLLIAGPFVLACLAALLAPRFVRADSIIPRLAHCLADLRASKEESVVSDCALADVGGIVGRSRDAIRQALVEPRWCSEVQLAVELDHCSEKPTWGYSFYRTPGPGGGPELVLRFANDRVERAEWVYTQ